MSFWEQINCVGAIDGETGERCLLMDFLVEIVENKSTASPCESVFIDTCHSLLSTKMMMTSDVAWLDILQSIVSEKQPKI